VSAEKLAEIAQEISQCALCALHTGRTHTVPGEGPASAKIMLIGEGPGYHEDRKGRPFVGPAGQFLSDLLNLAGLSREDVFIGNVIKCRPPNNRDPQPEEIQTCTTSYLFRQIEAIDPRVIVTLGRFSMSLYVPNERISRIHGQPRTIDGRLVVPMMHPAAALHQPKNRPLIEEDFRRLPEILARAEQQTDQATPAHHTTTTDDTPQSDQDDPPLEQLSMF
jgi:DNA polymerase